jgi:hypothetical protein
MVKTVTLTLLAGVMLARDARALHDPDITDAEFKCQAATSKVHVKFWAAKGKCLAKCITGARRLPPINPEADCIPPFGGRTLACIADPRRGVEAKAIAAIDRACITVPAKTDCPECYSARSDPTDCSAYGSALIVNGLSNPSQANLESQVDAFGFLFCNDNPNTPAENACEQGLVTAMSKFIGCKFKCYDKCHRATHRGTIAGGACNPPSPADWRTQACLFDPIKGCEAKAIAALDEACFAPPADKPECLEFTPSGFVGLLESWQDGNIPQVYCVD